MPTQEGGVHARGYVFSIIQNIDGLNPNPISFSIQHYQHLRIRSLVMNKYA